MNAMTLDGARKLIWIVSFAISCVSLCWAQTNTSGQYIETNLPPGVYKGIVKVGDRFGVVIVGGKTVYSNDTFTLTTHGLKAKWKVLAVANKKARFARAVPDQVSPYATPPDCVPNFGEFVMLLDKEAKAYQQASTQLLKDKIIAAASVKAQDWCLSNRTMCVKGVLADVIMLATNTARVRLKKKKWVSRNLFRIPTSMLTYPLKKQSASRRKQP